LDTKLKGDGFMKRSCWKNGMVCVGVLSFLFVATGISFGGDLEDVRERGVLRHLGVPYANFVTGAGDGMDVELMKGLATYLGVDYAYVKTSWKDVIGDLTGKTVKAVGNDIEILGTVPVKGDVIANGFTIIEWRKKIVSYSTPTFPTQIWVMARADSPMTPIRPSGNLETDILAVKNQLRGRTLSGVANTCLEPSLYGVAETGARVKMFEGNLNELAPAVINGDAEAALLDVPDALIALEKWSGQVKIIGPLSEEQCMGVAFAKSSPKLLAACNQYLEQCRKDGSYLALVRKYYAAVFEYYKGFFED
jgi:ABC-type amino acid transport substrate-binding protein